MEIYEGIGHEPEFPELDRFAHLTDYLSELGTVSSGINGAAPISWTDIASWKQLTHTYLESWEARVLMRLSKEYCAFMDKAKEMYCPAPYSTKDEHDARRKITDSRIRGSLNGR